MDGMASCPAAGVQAIFTLLPSTTGEVAGLDLSRWSEFLKR